MLKTSWLEGCDPVEKVMWPGGSKLLARFGDVQNLPPKASSLEKPLAGSYKASQGYQGGHDPQSHLSIRKLREISCGCLTPHAEHARRSSFWVGVANPNKP